MYIVFNLMKLLKVTLY